MALAVSCCRKVFRQSAQYGVCDVELSTCGPDKLRSELWISGCPHQLVLGQEKSRSETTHSEWVLDRGPQGCHYNISVDKVEPYIHRAVVNLGR